MRNCNTKTLYGHCKKPFRLQDITEQYNPLSITNVCLYKVVYYQCTICNTIPVQYKCITCVVQL